MRLTWMPPVSIKHPDYVYHQVRHWLVNEEGRILATIIEPQPNNQQESFDARLYYTHTDDEAYFISLEDAQKWCEKRSAEYSQSGASKPESQAAIPADAPK